MPTPSQSLSAVIVSGGKQYRVAPGDRILVDRLAAETGSELTLDRVLLLADGDDVKVGLPGLEGATVTAMVLGDRRGKKIDVLRYKSKKRVRVRRGARADLTALEILTVGGKGAEKPAKVASKPVKAAASKPVKTAATKSEQAASKRESAKASTAPAPEAAGAETAAPEVAEAPKPARRTRAPKAAAEETTDGA